MDDNLDGLPAGERRAQWVGYFRDRMHPEAEGNLAIAKSVAKLLVAQGLLEPTALGAKWKDPRRWGSVNSKGNSNGNSN